MVPYINPANYTQGVQLGHALGFISSHRLTIGKTKKIFFSENMRLRAFIFCVYQCLAIPFINPANRNPWGLKWPRPGGVIICHRLIYNGEKCEKIFFSETTRPKACIFSMLQCLVVPYIKPANHAPWYKLATPRGEGGPYLP